MLFGPADLGRGEGGVFFRRGRDYASALIDDQSASATGANINAE
jgi:hypothetical protein